MILIKSLPLTIILKIILLNIAFISLFSCSNFSNNDQNEIKTDIQNNEIDFREWWTNYKTNIDLTTYFTALDIDSSSIPKNTFLEKLANNNVVPVKVKTSENSLVYLLTAQKESNSKEIDASIRMELKADASQALKLFNLEFKKIPEHSFNDINDLTYSNASETGKFLVIKTWFINCKPCIEEIPILNDFVDHYKKRDDIEFISLALDSKKDLKDFLLRRDFKYKIIPNQEVFIKDSLNLSTFPTHIIVNKNNEIIKAFHKADKMISFINENNIFNPKKRLPPPPPM